MRPVGAHGHAVRVWQARPGLSTATSLVRASYQSSHVGVHHDLRVEPVRVRGAAIGEVDVWPGRRTASASQTQQYILVPSNASEFHGPYTQILILETLTVKIKLFYLL